MTEEIGRYFTLSGANCLHDGCKLDGSSFGYCEEHYAEQVSLRHARLARHGRTRVKPACFDTEESWREYEVFALDGCESTALKADPCIDCCPEYQGAMASDGRCGHKEVIFVRSDKGGLEGITSEKFSKWDRACLGQAGKVIKAPDNEARQEAVRKHFAKTGGRSDLS